MNEESLKCMSKGVNSDELGKILFEVKIVLEALSDEEKSLLPKSLFRFLDKKANPVPGLIIDFDKELKGQISETALFFLGYIVRHYVKK